MWKKWSFYALCASAVFAILLNFVVGFGVAASFGGLADPIVLYLLIRSKWHLLN